MLQLVIDRDDSFCQTGEIMYLRIDEVMKLAGASVDTIYRWAKEGRFPNRIKIDGYHVRWSAREVEQWVKERGMSKKSKKIDI